MKLSDESITLIITSKDDGHSDHVIAKLNERGLKECVVRLNTEDFARNSKVTFKDDIATVELIDSHRGFTTSEVGSVWFRRPKEIEVNSGYDNYTQSFLKSQWTALLRGLYFATHDHARWINPLPSLHRSRHKLQQIQLANSIGFSVPPTAITNDPLDARAFFDEFGSVCTKSLDEPNFQTDKYIYPLFTRIIKSRDEFDEFDSIRVCPILIQKFIQKSFDVRVTVMGKKVTAVRINSQAFKASSSDFRGVSAALLDHEEIEIPPQTMKKIFEFVGRQKLVYSALDFCIEAGTGEWFFLENNSNGQWLWLEFSAKVPLTDHMIELLRGEK